jgi:hypothetical protein
VQKQIGNSYPNERGIHGTGNTITRNLQLQKARIQQYLPKNAPDFQVNVYKAYGHSRRSTFMVMIQTDKNNVSTLTNMMKVISKKCNLGFFQFLVYLGLNYTDKQKCIEALKRWSTTFKSIVVDGFNDTNNNIPMKMRINDGSK